MRTKSAICGGRTRGIEDAVKGWHNGAGQVLEARDVKDVLRECLGLRDLLREWRDETWRRAFDARIGNFQAEGELLRNALGQALETFAAVQDLIRRAGSQGETIEAVPEFEQAGAEVRRMSEDLARRWPWIDGRQVEEARQAFGRGEAQSIEDVLREL